MTRPTYYLVRMLVFLAAVAVVAALLSGVLLTAFTNNPLLNSVILLVLAVGIGWNLRQVLRLSPEVTWLETWQQARARISALPSPRLLAPMASMLASRASRGATASTVSRSLRPRCAASWTGSPPASTRAVSCRAT